MLATLGICTIFIVLLAILTNRASPLVALIAVPIIAALIGGFGFATSGFIIKGITSIAPIAAMFVFAIIFFGVMTDAGMLDPIIDGILKSVGAKPARITMGTALLSLLIHLDGSGAICFLITVPAMLPLYDRLGMDRRILACMAALPAGVNFLPWTGPTIRSSAALHIPTIDIFKPILIPQLVGLVFVFVIAYWLGKKEERRLGLNNSRMSAEQLQSLVATRTLTDEEKKIRRPKMFVPNLLMTAVVMVIMIGGWVDPTVMFMVGTVLALMMNYPDVKMQKARVDAHAKAALMMASILLAAGCFTGIMTNTGMLTAIAKAAVSVVPPDMAQHIPFVLGLVSMPLSLLFDPDSFYLGVMPVIAEVYKSFGGDPIHIAQAAIFGLHTTGFPVSPLTPATFLLVGLSGIELSAHQRFSFKYLYAATVVMTFTAVIIGVIPL